LAMRAVLRKGCEDRPADRTAAKAAQHRGNVAAAAGMTRRR
jgi:hypothetical protein